MQDAVISPAADNELAPGCDVEDRSVIVGANGVGGAVKMCRVGRAKREDVEDVDAGHIPAFGEADAAPDGWVVFHLGGRGWIEQDEGRHWPFPPPAPQVVSPCPTRRKGGAIVVAVEQRRLLRLSRRE